MWYFTWILGIAFAAAFAILNANAAIAYDAMKAGSRGFNGVFTNFHPDLYKWLYTRGAQHPALAAEIANFLVLAALAEPFDTANERSLPCRMMFSVMSMSS